LYKLIRDFRVHITIVNVVLFYSQDLEEFSEIKKTHHSRRKTTESLF